MEPLVVLEARLQQWSVPNDVREAVRGALAVVEGEGASLVDAETSEHVTVAVRDRPVAVYVSPFRVSAALDPVDAERAHRSDSAIGLSKDSDATWVVHCRYGRLDPSRLNAVTALLVKALRRHAPHAEPRQVVKPVRRRATSAAGATGSARAASAAKAAAPRRTTPAAEEERRRVADAAIPRCPVPGCNLPMVGGSCGFHD